MIHILVIGIALGIPVVITYIFHAIKQSYSKNLSAIIINVMASYGIYAFFIAFATLDELSFRYIVNECPVKTIDGEVVLTCRLFVYKINEFVQDNLFEMLLVLGAIGQFIYLHFYGHRVRLNKAMKSTATS